MFLKSRSILTVGLYCALFVINVNSQNVENRFSCEGRPSGYYADVQAGCQIYHMCDGLGRQFSYSCPNTTLFQQRMLICDHWYMVNCSKAELDYGANLLIGQREKPFVEDDDENPYHRTPRPDLLAHPSAAEYNIIYRTGRAQQQNNKNLVGAEINEEDNEKYTNQPAYFLPSHWSTEYYKGSTEKPIITKPKTNFKKPYYPIKGEEIVKQPEIQNEIKKSSSDFGPTVNFKSNFKATTPVYPKVAPTEVPIIEEEYSPNALKTILLPPETNQKAQDRISSFSSDGDVPVINFASKYKATTPVYPKFVDPEIPLASEELPVNNNAAYGLSSIIEPPKNPFKPSNPVNSKLNLVLSGSNPEVNFKSNFQATTPVYPTSVTPEEPLAIEEEIIDPNNFSLSTVIQPPKSYEQTHFNTAQEPSIYYQPPSHHESLNEVATSPEPVLASELNWQELRKRFFIPDYEFPLDSSAIRPNYGEGLSSFQVNPLSYIAMPRQNAHG